MDVFLGLLLAVNNFSLDFDETLKLSLKRLFKFNLFVL